MEAKATPDFPFTPLLRANGRANNNNVQQRNVSGNSDFQKECETTAEWLFCSMMNQGIPVFPAENVVGTENATQSRTWEFLSLAAQFGILLTCLFLGLDAWIDGVQEFRERQAIETARRQVIDLAVRSEPEGFLRARLFESTKYARTGRADVMELVALQLERVWGLHALFYRFDTAGKLTRTAPKNAPNQRLMGNIFFGLTASPGAALEETRKKIDSRIPFLFGEGKDLWSLRGLAGLPIEVYSQEIIAASTAADFADKAIPGLLMYERTARGGLIVHFPRFPDETDLFRRVCLKAAQKASSGAFPAASHRIAKHAKALPPICGLRMHSGSDFMLDGKTIDPVASAAFDSLPKSAERIGKFTDDTGNLRRWVFIETVSGRIVYGGFEIEPHPLEGIRFGMRAGGVLLFIAGMGSLLWGGKRLTLGLRRLLLGLFIASSSIPLAGIALGSLDIVEMYQTVVGSRIKAQQEGVLRDIVSEFDGYLHATSRRLRTALEDPRVTALGSATPAITADLERRGLLDLMQGRDAAGRLIFSYPVGGSGRNETIMSSFAAYGVERFAPERYKNATGTGNPFSEAVVRRDDMGFSTILTHPEELQLVQLGHKRLLLFFKVYAKETGPIAWVETQLSIRRSVQAYLKRRAVERIAFENGRLHLYALDTAKRRWILPPPPGLAQELLPIALAVGTLGRGEFLRTGRGDFSGDAVSLPCPTLGDLTLVSFYPSTLLRERISRIWINIALGGTMFLGLIFLMARGLSQQLLAPLQALELGLDALRRRDFSYLLPDAGQDELGRLFSAFNEMMEGAKDLELARHVQEGLIPSSFPRIEGYDLHGRLVNASDLGGDLLDGFALPDGRLCFLVGDIAGHGVGAALMMAFARAVTFHRSMRDGFTPRDLALDLDRLLRERRQERLFMGLVCGLLDPKTHQLEMIVAGMPYPLLVRADQSREWLGFPNLPLGSGSRPVQTQPILTTLYPGDRLMCFSDGVVEAVGQRGDALGYDVFADWVTAMPEIRSVDQGAEGETPSAGLSAAEALEMLLTKHAAFRNGPASDDVTMFFIGRPPKSCPKRSIP
ncbi:MAG: SpoIIE family protein phosphatase [Candidatus Ozemobacteraceae bacterium]